MKYRSKRGIGELPLLIFNGVLLILCLYAWLVYQSRVGVLALILALCEAGMLYFYFARTEYELTESALIVRERKPFPDKEIPFKDMKNYRLGGRAGGRMGRLYDIYLVYTDQGKDRFLVLTPEDKEDFIAQLRQRCGRDLSEDEVL